MLNRNFRHTIKIKSKKSVREDLWDMGTQDPSSSYQNKKGPIVLKCTLCVYRRGLATHAALVMLRLYGLPTVAASVSVASVPIIAAVARRVRWVTRTYRNEAIFFS